MTFEKKHYSAHLNMDVWHNTTKDFKNYHPTCDWSHIKERIIVKYLRPDKKDE